jgi:hypothetical protein
MITDAVFGTSDGINSWDINETEGDSTATLDQALRGQDLQPMSGTSFANATNSVTGMHDWTKQKLEPVYAVGIRVNGGIFGNTIHTHLSAGSGGWILKENRDFYQEQLSFDGTVGTPRGPLANRPTTCTPGRIDPATGTYAPGAAYWTTDQGNWNQSGDGKGSGELYVCIAPNVWTRYYTPYTYPHPLVSGLAAPPPSIPPRQPTTARKLNPQIRPGNRED